MARDFIDPSEATKIRVCDDGGCDWWIDAADDSGLYTEFVWTHYNDKMLTRDEAILRVPEFAAYIGRPDLVDKVEVSS